MTKGYELLTAITNVIIFITSVTAFFMTKNKSFKNFYYLVFIDGMLGAIIHGIVMNETCKNIFWIILSFFFSITVNLVLLLFINSIKKLSEKKNIALLIAMVTILYLIIVLETIFGIDFLNTFIVYAALSLTISLFISIYLVIKTKTWNNVMYMIGIICQFLGGIFLLNKSFHIWYLDKNGIYHMFMVLTIIFFLVGNIKENNNKKLR